jgi:hypothetical protein
LQYGTLLADLAQICHGGATGTTPAELPYVPQPSDAEYGCPLCSGFATAVALLEPALGVELRVAASTAVAHPDGEAEPDPGHALHPPARGPPAFV